MPPKFTVIIIKLDACISKISEGNLEILRKTK